MNTRALILDHDTQRRIQVAVIKARANPTSLGAIRRAAEGIPQGNVIKLADRKSGYRPPMQSEQVLIQQGYRAAISFEYQPVGLCRHLSISVDVPGNLPSPAAVEMIAEAFDFSIPSLTEGKTHMWVEEFEPGHEAVNLVQPE